MCGASPGPRSALEMNTMSFDKGWAKPKMTAERDCLAEPNAIRFLRPRILEQIGV
jgi:hypothetical protein